MSGRFVVQSDFGGGATFETEEEARAHTEEIASGLRYSIYAGGIFLVAGLTYDDALRLMRRLASPEVRVVAERE